jgi:hypothetical protein
MKKIALLALASGLAFAAVAQDKQETSVGVINGVKGAVTVSSAQAVKRAVNGMAVPDGASILVSNGGAATLALHNGCVIALKGSEYVRVDASTKCDQVQAAVQQVMPTYKLAQAPIGGGIVPPPASDDRRAAAPLMGGNVNNAVAIGTVGVISVIALTASTSSSTPVSGQ